MARGGDSNKKSKDKSSSDGEKSKSVNKPQEPQPSHNPNDPERWYKEGDALADADLETTLKMTAAIAADMRALTFYPEGPCKTNFLMGDNMVHAWQLTKFTAEMRTLHDQYLVASRNPQFFGGGTGFNLKVPLLFGFFAPEDKAVQRKDISFRITWDETADMYNFRWLWTKLIRLWALHMSHKTVRRNNDIGVVNPEQVMDAMLRAEKSNGPCTKYLEDIFVMFKTKKVIIPSKKKSHHDTT